MVLFQTADCLTLSILYTTQTINSVLNRARTDILLSLGASLAAIYVERTDPNKDMDQNETDDESKPLLNKKEVREVVDQISRLGREEQDLIAESGKKSGSPV